MKRAAILLLSVLLVAAMALGASTAFAAKPMNVIETSNGFPSGPHFNLNIHGKKADYTCDSTAGGRSVFVAEYGDSTITFVSNKKSSVTELTVLDPCAEAFDGTPAVVQLPKEDLGYYVFARILAKPNNGKNGEPSSIILYPNPVPRLCNDTDPENPEFGNYTTCPDDSLLALGLVTTEGVYELTEQGFERFDSGTSKGKGNSKALDITGLFMWTGWVCDASLDANEDGVIDENDVPIEYDLNLDGVIDADELGAWLDAMAAEGLATFHDNQWIFNIADLVLQDQKISNSGSKLLQIRFYPVATTEFIR
ncbi:MAG: hypothetical protein IBX68_03515 [Dehalococcoidia bacterium]|nr:hypothetical protein [Dehalococcoidia bacterium]